MTLKLTVDAFEDYQVAEDRRLELSRAAREADAIAKAKREGLVAALKATGKASARRGPFTIVLGSKPGNVPWKDELMRRIDADELARIRSAVPAVETVSIERAAA